MKQTPEQPQPDLFDPPVEKPIKMYPPDLNVRESTGYIRPIKQSREQLIRQSSETEVLSPHETYGLNEVDDFIPYNKRKWAPEDLQQLVDVVREATKEEDEK